MKRTLSPKQKKTLSTDSPNRFFHPEEIRIFGYKLFDAVGVKTSIAHTVVDALVTTSLRGTDSHGVRLLAHYTLAVREGRINPNPKFTFTQTMPATGILDADDSFGIAAGMMATVKTVEMAQAVGVGTVSVRNSSHFGAAGLYTIEAAKHDMIAFACTHVEALVLPHNGVKPFLGTNAVSIAVPCEGEEPICLDMATTTISFNKLMMMKARDEELPAGSAADKTGNSTVDPRAAVFLTHFGGYKGYGVSLMVEVFSSLLSGMSYGPHLTPMYPLTKNRRKLGHFFCSMNIGAFQKPDVFKKRMKDMAEELRSIPSVSHDVQVLVAGDPEKKTYKERIKNGIVIPEKDWEAMKVIATELHLTKYIPSHL